MEFENVKTEEKQLTPQQRASRKFYLKNKEKIQKLKTEWNRNAYENSKEYADMVKLCSKNYYYKHREEIRAKQNARRQAKKLLVE